MKEIEIRPMQPGDWPNVSAVYREGIETGQATFQTDVPSWEEWDRAHLKTCRLVALGVVPNDRRHGIAEMLVLHIIENAMLKRGFIGECSLILENNVMMNRFLEAIGAEKYKTYRIYQRSLGAAA